MDDGTRSIGALARESGLSISALRFYDSAGVLRPARVDSCTGYRWYSAQQVPQARLIAGLRRVSMPLPDICDVLACRDDLAVAGALLDRHLRRLEDGLADARRNLVLARGLLDRAAVPTATLSATGADLSAAIDSVRFAVSNDRELPALGGILFDYDGAALWLVASDRFRLAVAAVPVHHQQGPAVQVIAPMSMLGTIAEEPVGDIALSLSPAGLTIDGVHGTPIDAVFPDYQRLLHPPAPHPTIVDRAQLLHRLAGPSSADGEGPARDVHLAFLPDGTIDVVADDHEASVRFRREFLLQAIEAGDADQLLLSLDGRIGPLAMRHLDRAENVSLLMPMRPHPADHA